MAVERAVGALLEAMGLDRDAPDLAETPARVAASWKDEILDGYGLDPGELLGEKMETEGAEGVVAVMGIPFRSMCPHHLLPAYGQVHLAYLPRRHLIGFSQLGKLVDCYAHRLALQEDVARNIADALTRLLPARGAGCVIEATQLCLSGRGADARPGARVLTASFTGAFEDRPELQAELLRAARGAASDGLGPAAIQALSPFGRHPRPRRSR